MPGRRDEERAAQIRNSAYRDEDRNPCLKEQNLSFKCLNENNFDQDSCQAYFNNYKACKKFWNDVKFDRRQKGIKPDIPPIVERAKLKEEYMQNKKQF